MLITIGIFGFLCYYLYDFNEVELNKNYLKPLFLIGTILQVFSILGLIIESFNTIEYVTAKNLIFIFFAVLFLGLLIYTLFFALPFDKTYIQQNNRKTYQEGMYALCRHPGVLWYIGLFSCIVMALPNKQLLFAALLFSLMNMIYIIIQDNWTFVNQFDDYKTYKEKTPFLIPNKNSIRKMMVHYKGEQRDEL